MGQLDIAKSLIGGMITYAHDEKIVEVFDMIQPDMFETYIYEKLYKALMGLYGRNLEITVQSLITAMDAIKKEHTIDVQKVISDCLVNACYSHELIPCAKILLQEYKKKMALAIMSKELTVDTIDEEITEISEKLYELNSLENKKGEMLKDVIEKRKKNLFVKKDIVRLQSNVQKLDQTVILEGGDVIVIGARPGVGKSAFVTQTVYHTALSGKRIGFFNLEMTEEQVYHRMLAYSSDFDMDRIKFATYFLSDEEQKFKEANERLQELDIYISSGSKTIENIRNESKHKEFDLIIIDYIQLVKSCTYYNSRAVEVGMISKKIKELAMELNIPIIVLSQLNRTSEARENNEPLMSELRETGDIEQDASVVILLWKIENDDDGYNRGIKVDKNRHGRTSRFRIIFDGDNMQFHDKEEKKEKQTTYRTDIPFETADDIWKEVEQEELPFD